MHFESPTLLKEVFREAISACSPKKILPQLIEVSENSIRIAGHDSGHGPLHVFGSGKAAVSMANSLHSVLGDRITGGVIVSPEESPTLSAPLVHFTGDHPIPTDRSLRAGNEMMQAMTALKDSDQFVYLLSGGSSALMEVPIQPLSIENIAAVTELLLKSGLPIEDTNMVRVPLSQIKGGGLGTRISAKGIVLVMSDVMGNALSVIGSGPFWPIERDYTVCMELLRQQNLWHELPAALQAAFTRQPDDTHREFRQIQHEIVADNNTLLLAVQASLEKRKKPARIASDCLAGEATKVGQQIADLTLITAETMKSGEKLALLFSGETTVTVKGKGTGGRCQELALSALATLRGNPDITVFAAGSDGRDGPTDAAGAVADRSAWNTACKLGLSPEDFLARNDSYHFFQSTGSLIHTGSTGINLLDVVIALIQR